mgnify:CR=1 FL=1
MWLAALKNGSNYHKRVKRLFTLQMSLIVYKNHAILFRELMGFFLYLDLKEEVITLNNIIYIIFL